MNTLQGKTLSSKWKLPRLTNETNNKFLTKFDNIHQHEWFVFGRKISLCSPLQSIQLSFLLTFFCSLRTNKSRWDQIWRIRCWSHSNCTSGIFVIIVNRRRCLSKFLLETHQLGHLNAHFYEKRGIYSERMVSYVLFKLSHLWGAGQRDHVPSIGTSDKRKEQCLVNTAEYFPSERVQVCCTWRCNTWTSSIMQENQFVGSGVPMNMGQSQQLCLIDDPSN